VEVSNLERGMACRAVVGSPIQSDGCLAEPDEVRQTERETERQTDRQRQRQRGDILTHLKWEDMSWVDNSSQWTAQIVFLPFFIQSAWLLVQRSSPIG
jgi:hypothetical protein